MRIGNFDFPASADVSRTPEQQADQDELRAVLLRQMESRGHPAAIPGPVFLDGPPAPITAPPRRPREPKRPKPAAEPARPVPPPGPVFDRLALYRPAARPIEPYEMPGGGLVYPHPLSGAERKHVNILVSLNLQALYRDRDRPRTEPEEELRSLEGMLDSEILGDICHAVVSARVGPESGAARVFQDEDAEGFYRNPGWEEAAQAIAALSRGYAAGRTEADCLREALRGFFGGTLTMLDWCASQLASVSWPATGPPSPVQEVQQTLRSCATSLRPWTQRETWAARELAGLGERLGKGR